jgi:4-oxalomesaconate tautomerase
VDYDGDGPDGFRLKSAGLVRTARLIARGEVMVPSRLLVEQSG